MKKSGRSAEKPESGASTDLGKPKGRTRVPLLGAGNDDAESKPRGKGIGRKIGKNRVTKDASIVKATKKSKSPVLHRIEVRDRCTKDHLSETANDHRATHDDECDPQATLACGSSHTLASQTALSRQCTCSSIGSSDSIVSSSDSLHSTSRYSAEPRKLAVASGGATEKHEKHAAQKPRKHVAMRAGINVDTGRVQRRAGGIGAVVSRKPGRMPRTSQRDGNDGKRTGNADYGYIEANNEYTTSFEASLQLKKARPTSRLVIGGSVDEAPTRSKRSTTMDGESRSALKNSKAEYELTTRDLLTAFTKVCCASSDDPDWTQWNEYFRTLTEGFDVGDYLQKFSHIFRRDSDSEEVRIKLTFNVCGKNFSGLECTDPRCVDLHCCKFFLFGEGPICESGESCRYGHDLDATRNLQLLQKHFLDHLMTEEIALLLKHCGKELPPRSDSQTSNACSVNKNVQTCPQVDTECEDRVVCGKDSHNYSLCAHQVTNSRSLSVLPSCDEDDRHSALALREKPHLRTKSKQKPLGKRMGKLPSLTKIDDVVERESSGLKVQSSEARCKQPSKICVFHLRGLCRYGSICSRYHSKNRVPFQWQWSETSGKHVDRVWKSLEREANWDSERAFCDPSRDLCTVSDENGKELHINFARFRFSRQGDEYSGVVRRLGTKSVDAETHDLRPFTTLWKWYNRRDNGMWKFFGKSSDAIERAYKEKQTVLALSSWSEVIFESMLYVDRTERRQRMVKRRPALYNAQSETKIQGSMASNVSGNYPTCWKLAAGSTENDFELIEVWNRGSTEQEYREIRRLFTDTLPSETIKSLKRIQNTELWEEFCRYRTQLEKKHGGKRPVAVRRLFHGTASKYFDAICQQGFDFRLSGLSVGTRYGKGSYFARDAMYSKDYCQGSNRMLVVQVIVGEFTKGEEGYTRPPPKDPTQPLHKQQFYDTCVDDPDDPSIFVVFHHHQSYPEYIIEF